MRDQPDAPPDPFDLDDDNATFAKLAPVKTASNRVVYAVIAAGGIAALGWLAIALH